MMASVLCSAIRVQNWCYCFVHLKFIREDTLELRARLHGILFYLNGLERKKHKFGTCWGRYQYIYIGAFNGSWDLFQLISSCCANLLYIISRYTTQVRWKSLTKFCREQLFKNILVTSFHVENMIFLLMHEFRRLIHCSFTHSSIAVL